ncbi:MAG: DUF1778 domain-containing protein [Patulibacter sp.]
MRRVEVRTGDDGRRTGETEVLRERGEINLGDESARAFLEVLDADAQPSPAMRELFERETPWAAGQ